MTVVTMAGEENGQEVGRVLADGFGNDPVMTWLFDEPGRAHKLEAFFVFLATEALVPLGATYVLPGSCACWTPPNTPDWSAELNTRFSDLLLRTCTVAEMKRLGALGGAMQEKHPPGPLWYLGSIATRQEAQGKGLGSLLLRESLQRVDAAELPAYLESTNPRNQSIYERHGFLVTGTIPLEDGPTLTTMWREPQVR